MNALLKATLLATTLAAVPFAMIAPANAQVAGVATAEPAVAIARTTALGQGYQQIGKTYASYAQQIQAKRKEINDINAQLDTNKDRNLTQDEYDAAVKAKSPLLGQLQTKEQEVGKLQEPIVRAQLYVVENIAMKYAEAQQKVVTAKKINFILTPDSFSWAPDAIDVTGAITEELNKLVPTVATAAPADWKPSRQSAAIFQQVQQLLENAAMMQAAAAQQKPAAAPAAGTQPASR